MRKTSLFFPVFLSLGAVLAVGCGGAAAGGAAPALAKDAKAFSLDGFSIGRPDAWEFVAVDSSVAPDTVAVLHGPLAQGQAMRPVVQVMRRKLNAEERRRPPAHILTAMMTELVQTYEGFKVNGEPAEITLSGQPAAQINVSLTEALGDGGEVQRDARFYSVVTGGDIWIISCMGPADGSAGGAIDQVVSSVRIGS